MPGDLLQAAYALVGTKGNNNEDDDDDDKRRLEDILSLLVFYLLVFDSAVQTYSVQLT